MASIKMHQNKMLDLRYNEMWNDWDGTDECQSPKKLAHDNLVLSWEKLNVTVKITEQNFFQRSKTNYKQILHNVSGVVQSGSLLGIMGPSGSGKTTLMTTISHRTKGNFEGKLFLNGQPVSEEMMIKISSFVPQHDLSFDQLTALEHLSLMAHLKMDRDTTEAALQENIDNIVKMLGMGKFLDTRIAFLSGGERKKVALAVQIINDPPVLFCDEITTGLDSYSAAHTVNLLRRIARTGKIVICTLHQPASGVFGKLDEVILMSNGRLAYQGPTSMVKRSFQKFNYECPNLFNEADFVITILNSEDEKVKRDVDKMCELSLTNKNTNLNFFILNDQVKQESNSLANQLNSIQYLHTQKPHWQIQFRLILGRSVTCFLRSYKARLLELGSIMFTGCIITSLYSNMQVDSNVVQNWEGFWFSYLLNIIFIFLNTAVSVYQVMFSVVHREVHNKVYPLSAYYLSQLIIMVVWLIIQTSSYCSLGVFIVGIQYNTWQLIVFFLVAIASFSYGCLLSAYFSRLENALIVATIYEFITLPLSGAYLSIKSLPYVLYYMRYLSLFFLGCETVSILFWDKIKHIPCIDGVTNYCLDNGIAVLDKYGYIREELNFDLMILVTFIVLANIFSYFGVLKKMKKQPAY